MKFLLQILTWWHGQSLGTRFFTWRNGSLVGEDEQGNKFYENKTKERRWVIYNGEIEASRISPEWHGWLHHTFDECPANNGLPRKKWEKPHTDNLTGTPAAYHPPGSIFSSTSNEVSDYQAWKPE